MNEFVPALHSKMTINPKQNAIPLLSSTQTLIKSLLNPKTHPKPSLSSFKSISSLASIQNPPLLASENLENPTLFDPLHFLNHYTKSTQCTITNTRILHAHFLRAHFIPTHLAIANSLLDCYSRSSSMRDALHLFDEIPQRNVVSWNFMVSGYNRSAMYESSWVVFCRMYCSGFDPDEFTYGSVLSACAALKAVRLGEQVYCLTAKKGYFVSDYARSGMIELLGKCGLFKDALRVFRDGLSGNVVIWNGVISGAVRNGEYRDALELFREMCCGDLLPNSFTFSSVLSACGAVGEVGVGREVHGWVIKCGVEDEFVGTAIVDLYAKCGKMSEAVKGFYCMTTRNVVSWTAVISGFVGRDDSISALEFFREMRRMGEEINKFTITSILTACAKPSMIEEAVQIHSLILKSGFYSAGAVGSALINAYSKIGAGELSEMVFREMGTLKDPGTWAALISSYAQNQNPDRAIGAFRRMLQESVRPDKFSATSVLSIIDCLHVGRQIHSYTLKVGLAFEATVGSSLSTMYSKCDNLEESYKAFQQIYEKDSVSWASMIAGFSEHGFADKALQLYREMPYREIIPDQMTLAAILSACSVSRSLLTGKEIHGHALRAGVARDIVVGGAIVNMYSKCSALELARRVFDMLPKKDEVVCSSLVSGYAQNECIEEAVLLFNYMLTADLTIDSFTISSILGVIAVLNNPSIGTQMHAHITKIGLNSDVSVGSSVVRLYSKCGSIEDCRKSFDQIKNPDLICWTAMIAGYAQHGKGAEALRCYKLLRDKGIKPDSVTFVAVLSACSRNGLVEEAYFYFKSMATNYGIKPGYRHYACMVDVLGRAGRLKEAERFIINMPIEPNGFVWGTLLAACVIHRDVELGKLIAKRIMDLNSCEASTYVSLSNMCADLGLWEEAEQIRNQMRGNSMRKEPGWSLV